MQIDPHDKVPTVSQIVKIAVFAKYHFYFEAIRSALKDTNISAECYSNINEFLNQTKTNKSDESFNFLFFPHYSEIIPKSFLNQFKCIGFHTGNLPHDRGGSPIQNKIVKGEYITKVSAILLSDEIDGGPVYCSRGIDLEFGNIEQILIDISIKISEMVFEIVTSNLSPTPQIGSALYASRIPKSNSKLELFDLSIKQIYDRIRMVDGLDYPRAFLKTDKYRILMEKAELKDDKIFFRGVVEGDI